MKKILTFLTTANVLIALPINLADYTLNTQNNLFFNNIIDKNIVIQNNFNNSNKIKDFTASIKASLLRANPDLTNVQESFFNFNEINTNWISTVKKEATPLKIYDQDKALTLNVTFNAHPWKPSKIYVLGDSLSDNGNATYITDQDFGIKPSPLMYQSRRFCDGLVTIEDINNAFGLTPLQPRYRDNNTQGTDYAFAGASLSKYSSLETSWLNKYSAQSQVNKFIYDHSSDQDKQNELVVFEFGSNDFIIKMLDNHTFNSKSETQAVLKTMLQEEQTALKALSNAGFHNFFVTNLPKISTIPTEIKEVTANEQTTIKWAVNYYNQQLKTILSNWNSSINNLDHVMLFDLYNKVAQLASRFQGFYKVMGAFHYKISIPQAEITLVRNPFTTDANVHKFLFFDGIHPTAYFDKMMSNIAYNQISAFNWS